MGQNKGQKRKDISLYSLGKTLKERFPLYYQEVLKYYQSDVHISLIPDFISWYETQYGTQQEFENSEIELFGLTSDVEYQNQLIVCVVVLFHSNYFEGKKAVLRKGVRIRLAQHFGFSGSTISHKLSDMRFENGDLVPYWKPILNLAKVICDTFCLERGIKKTFEIEDQNTLENEAFRWERKEAINGLEGQPEYLILDQHAVQ